MKDRRSFLVVGASALALGPVSWNRLGRHSLQEDETLGKQHLSSALVKEFVSNAHTRLERTQRLLEQEPQLIRASYEWSPGDFESAIDAAAHSGAIEIVDFLLDKGASYSLFVAAVLGHLETVKSSVERRPELIHSRGPHGIGLLQHALAGGEAAAEVAEFLVEKGADPDEQWLDLEYDEAIAEFAEGNYQITREERSIKFAIVVNEKKLFIKAGERPPKRLQYQGQLRFAVEGTPAELLFEQSEDKAGKCQRVLLKEGFPVGFAERVDD